MIKLLKAVYYWMSANQSYQSGDYEKALYKYKKLEEVFNVKLRHKAFYATLLMLHGDGANALVAFQNIVDQIDDNDQNLSDNNKYVRSYCMMYISGMKNSGEGERYHTIAKSLNIGASLRKCLPITENYK